MDKKIIPYHILYYLSLIPYIGFLIAWICSWVNIFRKTNHRKYIFYHYVFWLIPLCVAGGLVTVCLLTFMDALSVEWKFISALGLSYIACLIMSVSCIFIAKKITDRYDLKFMI